MANHLRELVDVVAAEHFGYWPMLGTDRVRGAATVTLEKSRAAVCFDGGEVGFMKGMAIIHDLVRLPYETCWIEFHHDVSDGRITFGVIASQTGPDVSGYIWHKDSVDGWTYFGGFKSTKGEQNFELIDVGLEEKELAVMMVECAMCFLSALNCTNVRRVEHKPDAKLQKARAKRGKQPLFSYWTLELDLSRPESSESLGGTHASPRLHLRRGHPRQYAAGKWTWVQPCVVGNKAAGMIHKDYALVTQ